MQFGVCGDPTVAAVAAKAGYDFAEWTVGALLKPREPEETFRAALKDMRAAGIPCPVVNCFVPNDLRITGPDVDAAALKTYAAETFKRAEEAGVDAIVFGSGGARRIPDGFDADRAHGQLVSFCAMAGPLAHDRGVTIVIEPLNRKACNVLNTVAECAALAREVAHPGVRLLVDAYHLLLDNDSCDDITANADILRHVHIATPASRLPPGCDPCDFGPFFRALKKGGYDGRVSIEAKLPDPAADLAKALPALRELAAVQV